LSESVEESEKKIAPSSQTPYSDSNAKFWKKRIPKAPNPKPFFCTQEAEENPQKNHYNALLQNSEQQKREEDQIKALENSKIANTTDRHTDHV
jgi:hypothetical protein